MFRRLDEEFLGPPEPGNDERIGELGCVFLVVLAAVSASLRIYCG